MTLSEIKEAVDSGMPVYWATENYRVIRDRIGQYLVHSQCNDVYWGLTHNDGITLSDSEDKFFSVETIK